MRKSRLFLLPLLLLILAVAACDNDTSSNAQDIEMPEELDCPCFSRDDIVSAFNGIQLVQCQVGSVSVSLGGSPADPDFEVACDANISNCTCTNMGSSQDVDDLVATFCLLDIMNSTLQLSGVGVETLACDFDIP